MRNVQLAVVAAGGKGGVGAGNSIIASSNENQK